MQSAVLAAAVVAASGSHVQSAPVRSSQTGPLFGTEWSGTVASNMTQIGFDMGMVLVNFTGQCATPSTQRARTVYGDFYTLLLLCDQGIEYEIAPPSRGGGCKKRVVGKDLDPRVCQVCTCPFCIRDTNGSYPNTTWDGPVKHTEIGGVEVTVWSGHQSSGEHDSHRVSVAFTGNKITGSPEPFGTNISDELWVTSRAMILNYQPTAPISDLRVPAICKQLGTGPDEPGALPGAADHATLHNRWSQHAMWPRRPAVSAPAELAAVAQPAWREDPAERAALLELAAATKLSGWVRKRNWGVGPLCDWELVGCNAAGRVKLLTLDFNNLQGTLPESIGDLSFLEDLDLEGNLLSGLVPASLGRLKPTLVQLGLGNNVFSGPMPPSLCSLNATHGSACDLSGSSFSCPLPCAAVEQCGASCK